MADSTAAKALFIFLTGMPGAGKTWWGAQIAAALNLHFIDLDSFIAEQERKSIPDLFATCGESGFRDIERRCLLQLIGNTRYTTVIACGGGTPCFFNNLDVMKEHGVVIYLQSDIQELARRIWSGYEKRPLLAGVPDLPVYLEKTLEFRKQFYEQSHYIVPANLVSIATFDKIIDRCIDRD